MPYPLAGRKELEVTEELYERDIFVGVDTHKDFHMICVIDSQGEVVHERSYPACAEGYEDLVQNLKIFGECKRIAIEGSGSYGRGLADHLENAGYEVYEALRPGKRTYNPDGKSDAIDALAAAKLAFWDQCNNQPKELGGYSEKLSFLICAYDSAISEATALNNALQGLIVKSPEELRSHLGKLKGKNLASAILRMRKDYNCPSLYALKSLAKRYMATKEEIRSLHEQISAITNTRYKPLVEAFCIGPILAATLIAIVGENPQRFGSEAAFAKSLGVCPIPASSGKSDHMRLNRGGNRKGNKAIHQIAVGRARKDPKTKEYIAKKLASGKTKKDAMRCLKRYIAREVYRLLCNCDPSKEDRLPDFKTKREALSLTLTAVAEKLDTYPSKISLLEKGSIRDGILEAEYLELLESQNILKIGSLQI